MKTKEIKIVPPEGYTIDRENSTFECIKFKPISKRWRDSKHLIGGWYLDNNDNVIKYINQLSWKDDNLDVFATEKQAKSAFAMAQISQIMANDERFGGVITDEEWSNKKLEKYCIIHACGEVIYNTYIVTYAFLAFHTLEQRALFLKENEDLVKDYLMID